MITTYNHEKQAESNVNAENDNILHIIKYLILILLFFMASYALFLIVWILSSLVK